MTDLMEQRYTRDVSEKPAPPEPATLAPDSLGASAAAAWLADAGGPGATGVDTVALPPLREPPVPGAAPGHRSPAQVLPEQLLRAVAQEILPRLRQAHRRPVPWRPSRTEPAIDTREVADLARLSMGEHGAAVNAYVDGVRQQGARLETLCLGLLTPAARRLGELWVRDECSFVDVTLGLARLQRALSGLCQLADVPPSRMPHRRVLLLPARGEQHTFGLSMVAEFFRRDGWEVVDRGATKASELPELVRRHWFDAIGFSLGSERSLEGLATDIRAARRASCNRITVILVGGPLFNEHPELAPEVGADGTAGDAREAPLRARHLTGLAAGSR